MCPLFGATTAAPDAAPEDEPTEEGVRPAARLMATRDIAAGEQLLLDYDAGVHAFHSPFTTVHRAFHRAFHCAFHHAFQRRSPPFPEVLLSSPDREGAGWLELWGRYSVLPPLAPTVREHLSSTVSLPFPVSSLPKLLRRSTVRRLWSTAMSHSFSVPIAGVFSGRRS